MNARLAGEESRAIELQKNRKRTEAECESLRKNITELDVGLRKTEAEKQAKENQAGLALRGSGLNVFLLGLDEDFGG